MGEGCIGNMGLSVCYGCKEAHFAWPLIDFVCYERLNVFVCAQRYSQVWSALRGDPYICVCFCFREEIFLGHQPGFTCIVLDSAKHVRCGGPAALPYPSSIVKKRRSSLSSIARLGIRYPRESVHVTHEFIYTCTWAQIDIPERDRHIHTYVHTYVHCENRSLIQSLALMRSTIML